MTLYRVVERASTTLNIAAYRTLTKYKMSEMEPKNTMVIKKVKINFGSSVLNKV